MSENARIDIVEGTFNAKEESNSKGVVGEYCHARFGLSKTKL